MNSFMKTTITATDVIFVQLQLGIHFMNKSYTADTIKRLYLFYNNLTGVTCTYTRSA